MRLCTGSCQTQDMDVLALDKTMSKSEVGDSNQMLCSRISKQESVCLPREDFSRCLASYLTLPPVGPSRQNTRYSSTKCLLWFWITQGRRREQSASSRETAKNPPLSRLIRERLFTALMWAAWIVLVIQLQRAPLKQRNSHAGKYRDVTTVLLRLFPIFLAELVLSLFQRNE